MTLPFRPLLLLLLGAGCAPLVRATDHQLLCAELARTERAFCAQAGTLGIQDAFLANMADECFLADQLRLTKAEFTAAVMASRAKLGAAYKPGPDTNTHLTWAPAKVDVSDDGTLGYTWGRYDYTVKGKDGKITSAPGIYLTIWKRQSDGSWKFVFDGGPELPDNPAALQAFLSRPDLPVAPK
jgi:ketosteroid isomerase-like protein